MSIARSLLARPEPHNVVVIAPRRSPLRALDGLVRGLVQDVTDPSLDLADVLTRAAANDRPLAVIVDDADAVVADSSAARVLNQVMSSAREFGNLVVAAMTGDDARTQFRGWVAEARRSRCGILLAPSTEDADVLGLRLARPKTERRPRGRALLIVGSEALPVQIAAE